MYLLFEVKDNEQWITNISWLLDLGFYDKTGDSDSIVHAYKDDLQPIRAWVYDEKHDQLVRQTEVGPGYEDLSK